MISINPEKMKVTNWLNGTKLNGYAGYYGKGSYEGTDYVIIALPHDPAYIDDLIREIDGEN